MSIMPSGLKPFTSYLSPTTSAQIFTQFSSTATIETLPLRNKQGERVSSYTYYLDESYRIYQEKGGLKGILKEPSVTWLGRAFDWICNKFYNEEKNQEIAKVNSIFLETITELDNNQKQWSWEGYQSFSNCSIEGQEYQQRWQTCFYSWDFSGLQKASNNNTVFPSSLQKCLNNEVISLYFREVQQLNSAKNCIFEKVQETYVMSVYIPSLELTFSLDIWDYDPLHFGYLFANQTTDISLSEQLVNTCYTDNLIQVSNPNEFRVLFNGHSAKQKVQGYTTVSYLKPHCANNFVNETWFVQTNTDSLNSVTKDCFMQPYLDCLITNFIKPYFAELEKNASVNCSGLNQNVTYYIISFPLGGNLTIQSANGIPRFQIDMNYSVDNTSKCYIDTKDTCLYRNHHRKKVTYISAFAIGVCAVIAIKVFYFRNSCVGIRNRNTHPNERTPLLINELPEDQGI